MRMKKFLTFLLTFAMVVSLLPASAFAANNTATTMRLAKTQGTVAVTNATGKQVTQTSNMKLYNGYQIKTGAKSYAWISLDDTKAAKLDANSVVSVQKSGQKLTLYLSSGNIFFNVKEKLSGGESFHIKTSTMTTGIRGTSGCVRVVNPRVTEIHLLTGEINVYTENPELHISKTAVLTAGQKATSLIAEEAVAATGEQADIIIETLTSHEVCGNCSVEIAADPELVERIEEEAPHLLPEKIADEAEDRLEADEEAAEEKQAAIEEAVNNQTLPEDVDPYFEKEEAGGGGGGGSSASVDENTVYEWDKLIEKINEFNAGTEDMTITLGENLPNAADLTRGTPLDVLPAVENAAGKTLTLNLSNYILGLNDTLVNETPLIITNADGYIGLLNGYNSANVAITNRDTLTLKNGTILTYGGNTGLQNDPGATFKMQGGSFEVGFIDADPATNELVLDAASADVDYSEAINNRAGAFVEMSGGTINAYYGIYDKSASVGVEPNVKITGGTINVLSNGIGVIVGGSGVMNGGVINVNDADGVGVLNEGMMTLSGGNIYVDAAGAVGVQMDGTALTMDGTKVQASAGTAVELNNGDVAFADGTVISAQNDADAVRITDTDMVSVERPVKADISTEKFTAGDEDNPDTNGLFYPMLDFLHEDASSAGTLLDRYGEVYDSKSLIYWINQFVGGDEDVTLTLLNDIELDRSFNIANNDGHTLTIDLDSYTLALQGTGIMNRGTLTITGETGARIKGSDTENTSILLSNQGELTVDGVEFVAPANGIGIAASNAISGMDNKVTVKNSHIDATAAGAKGIRIANLDSLVPVLNFTSSTMEVGNGTDTTAVGIQTLGGTVTITGTNTQITVNSGTGISADDYDNGIDGIVNANGGTMTVSGSAKGIAVEGGGDVTMNGMGMTLSNANGATGISVAKGGIFEGKSKAVTFQSPSENSTGIYVAAGATADLNGMNVNSSSSSNKGIKMVHLDGTADEMTTLNIVGDSWIFSEEDGYAVYSKYGTVNMSAGMLANRSAPGYGIYAENSAVNITGGNIGMGSGSSSTDANYNIYLVDSAFTMDGGAIEAVASIASNRMKLQCLYAENSTLNLMSGTITAKNNASPISVTNDTDITLGSSMVVKHDTADILEIRGTNTNLYKGEGPVDGYYTLILAANALNAADRFIAQVIAFNDGEDDVEIQLTEDVDLTTAEKYTMPDEIGDSSSDTKRLTIDLNNYNLILASQLNNHGLLSIRDDSVGENGVITGKEGVAITYLIANSGEMEWNNGTLKATADNTYGIANTGKLHVYDGVISIEDNSTSNSKAAIYNMGTSANSVVNINGGEIWASQAGTGNVCALKNSGSGTMNLVGGTVKAQTDHSIAVSNSGTMLMTTVEGGDTIVRAVADGAIGILNSGGTFTFEDGEVTATAAGAVAFANNNGATLALTGGSITAEETGATALQNVETISTAVGTVVQAVDDNRVCVGTLPEGCTLSAATNDEGYYYLESAAVTTWEDFVAAVAAFNTGSVSQTIQLGADLDPSQEMATAYPLPAIGNSNSSVLTIDLGTRTLGLPTTLATASSSGLEIRGSTGTITTGQAWGNSDYLITNNTTMTMTGGNIEVADGITGINNAGTLTLNGGTITASGTDGVNYAIGVYGASGTVNMAGGEIVVENGAIGIETDTAAANMSGGTIDVVSGTGISIAHTGFNMTGGTIEVENGTGLNFLGTAVKLDEGIITADTADAAAAIVVSTATVTLTEDMTVKATEQEKVFIGTVPDGFAVSNGGDGYYYLTSAAATVPMEVYNWEEFVDAVTAFNSQSSPQTITLMADIDPTAEQVAAADPLPAIGNGNASALTIDLGTRTLGLPTTLATASSSGLVIDGTTGTLTTGQAWDDSNYIINNYTNMTLNGGTIAVPIHADGINNTGTFTMEGGTMELDYSVGIHNSNAANLNGGTIRMISNDAYNGVPTPEGGNFSAYESVSDSGATLTMGADGSAGTTIIIEEGINYMESDVLYLMHMGIDNSVGCEMIVENGSFEIGSGDGIMNDGELTLNGGEFTVDGGRAIYNYGTFVMNDGQIDIYDGEGMTIDGTSTILAGGSIAIDPTATTTSTGVQALGDITFSGTAVEAAVGTAVKAVSDIAGKSMTLSEGSITADGSAVAVETNFTTVTFNEASMTVKAASSANVYVVAAGGTMIEGYEPADGGDGYFYLAVAAGTPVIEVEDDADFADAIAGLTDGNVQIILMDDVTLSTEYEFGDGEANVGALDINLNGYDLILNGTLFNNTGLYIYDTNGGGSIYSVGGSDTVYELIINNGTLVWEDVTLSLKDGQTGIWTVGELQMNSGSITAPDTANATTTNGVLYQAAAADRTTVEDAVTTTGSLTKVAQASD